MDIFICIGSSCHLKGSYNIIQAFKQQIAEHKLEDKINLSASFCLGHCQDGVTIKVNDQLITGLNAENAVEVFQNKILKELDAQ